MKILTVLFILAACSLTISAQDYDFRDQNANDAENLQNEFAKLTPNSPCKDGDNACVNDQFAQCVSGKFSLNACGGNLKCAALPLVNKAGTSIACTTEEDRLNRLADARGGAKGMAKNKII